MKKEEEEKTYNYEWLTSNEAFLREYEIRTNRDITKLCTYGIRPLDDAMACILPNELVVIGADSGTGKTELALQIAQHNLHRGKKVALYHLEGGWLEAISRMKFKDISEEYFSEHYYTKLGIEMDYRKWTLNLIQEEAIKDIERKVFEKYKKEYQDNLMLYSSDDGLTLESFILSLMDFHKLSAKEPIMPGQPTGIKSELDLDLIIIDHLQYFSLTRGEHEISEITAILREVKNITDNYGIPVILISHLRKKGKDRGLPDQEDFYGSSNIPKISSTAITIAPATTAESLAAGIFPTYFRVVKSRIGIRPNYAMLINFIQDKKGYDDKYRIHKLTSEGYIMPDCLSKKDMPRWAVGGVGGESESADRPDNSDGTY